MMPALLGIPALLRFIIGLVPLLIGYVSSFIARLATRTGLLATALVAAIMVVFSLSIQWLGEAAYSYIPVDYSNFLSSILPDGTSKCITIIMSMKIAVMVFDLKDRFISMANKVL
ncbi:DUF5455 family protein [Candidatus Pantoea formicae]|uniref:DUF5455 family protein n=1 Tax=Candidatus Pantoea formicae TaxID=2608355 RepID=UPI003ED94395